jgi:hypothetical protein
MSFSDLPPDRKQQLLDGRMIPLPDGVMPNFDNRFTETHSGPRLRVDCIDLATLFVFALVYVVWVVLKKFSVVECILPCLLPRTLL